MYSLLLYSALVLLYLKKVQKGPFEKTENEEETKKLDTAEKGNEYQFFTP